MEKVSFALLVTCLTASGVWAAEERPAPTPTPSPLPTAQTLELPAAPRMDVRGLEVAPRFAAAPSLALPSAAETALPPSLGQSSSTSVTEIANEPARSTRTYVPQPASATPAQASASSSSLAPISSGTEGVSSSPISSSVTSSKVTAASAALTTNESGAVTSAFTTTSFMAAAAVVRTQQVLSPNGRGKQGVFTVVGNLNLQAGGVYYFDFVNAGARLLTDLVQTENGFIKVLATEDNPFTIALGSYNPQGQSAFLSLTQFNPTVSYQWDLMQARNGIQGFSPLLFAVDDSAFRNAQGQGFFSVDQVGNRIVLDFTPVPEPGTWALLLTGAGLLGVMRWRARRA